MAMVYLFLVYQLFNILIQAFQLKALLYHYRSHRTPTLLRFQEVNDRHSLGHYVQPLVANDICSIRAAKFSELASAVSLRVNVFYASVKQTSFFFIINFFLQ